MRKIIVALAAVVAMAALAKGSKPDAEEEAFNEFFKGYYLAPNPQEALAKTAYAEKLARKERDAASPLAGFYFGAVKTSPELRDEWREAAEKAKAKWLKNAIELGLEGKTLKERVGENLSEIYPGTLDFIWGYFFATGDRLSPQLVIKRANLKPQEENEIDVTRFSAIWSLDSIGKDNAIVREELDAFAKTATDAEVRGFFDGKAPDRLKRYLSEEALKRVESLKPPKAERAEDAEEEEEDAKPAAPEMVTKSYEGYIAAKEGSATLVFTNATIAALADGEFAGRMGGAWVNGGKEMAAKGYNKEYRPGESVRVQFQCVDKGDGKEYVKCVRVVFTDSPEGVMAVCDYTGFVTLGYKKNALGFDFKDDANWKAVATSGGAGYGMAAISVAVPKGEERSRTGSALVGFDADYDAARERARAAGRDLFVLFTGSDWCVWCKRLEKEVLRKREFLDYATNKFECVVLDFPRDESRQSETERRRNAELNEKFGVAGFPSVFVIGAEDEAVKFKGGYERGGAKKLVANLHDTLHLKPLRKKYFGALAQELVAMKAKNTKILEEIGRPTDTNTAERVKAHFAKWTEEERGIVAKLEALDIPEELSAQAKAISNALRHHIAMLDGLAGKDIEELIEMTKVKVGEDDEDEDGEGGGEGGDDDDGEDALPKLPIEGAGTAIDLMEKVHMPFGERLFVAPEIAMLGDKAAGVDIGAIVREWLRGRPIRDINKLTPFVDYAADADKAWAAGARTPFVAIAHLAMGNTGLDAKGIAAERRKVWEMWKDDPRWPLASRIAYVSTWKSWNKELAGELTRISIDLKKKFIVSCEWKPEEIDRARWVLSFTRSNNKQVFEELRAAGVAFDPWLEAVSLAQWHIDKAWEERGEGFAATVTDEGWAGYKEHRAKAIEWAQKAYELRPDLSAPCTVGLTAHYGNTAKALVWYKRAAAICKDDVLAATKFAWGLRPRWGGDTRAMMDFFKAFLTDDFADTIMPAWAIDHIYWGVFKEETYRGPESNFEEWAELNAATIRHFSDLYMNGGYLKRDGVSLQTRKFVRDVFVTAAWSMGDMELFKAWREYGGEKEPSLTYLQAVKDTTTWRNAGMRALADWAAAQPESERADLLHALRHAFGRWEPARRGCRDHTHETRNYAPFAELILPRIYSGALTKDNTPDLQWGFLRSLAGSCLGTMALEPGGHDFTGVLPKNTWGDIDEGVAEMTVEFDLSVAGPDTKGEAMMHFDFGSSAKDFYQRFSVLTVANKTDEKDNRFAILPWPKGETKKSVKIVFRGRDVEVYDGGRLAYKRQLREGAERVKKVSFARSNTNSVPFDRIFIRAIARPPED